MALTYKAKMYKLKSIISQLTLLSNNIVLTSYLSGIYLESWFSWLWGGLHCLHLKKKTDRKKKHWKVKRKKNAAYEESKIIKPYIFGFKLYFWKKFFIPSNFIYSFYALQDIWNTVMIHQIWIYINMRIIIEIYLNRLSTITQIVIAMDCLWIMDNDG